MIRSLCKAMAMLFLLGYMVSCAKDDIEPVHPGTEQYTNKVALEWNKLLLEVERFTPGYKPPVSARTTGYIGLTAYEAVVHGMDGKYNSLGRHFAGLELPQPEAGELYDWEVSLNAAYEAAFYYFFPVAPASQQFRIITLADRMKAELGNQVPQETFNRSVDFGLEVAHAVYEWSKTDHWGHEGFLKNHDNNFIPVPGQGLWRPTYPDYQPALLPHWGKVRTFAATTAEVVPPPLTYDEDPASELYQQAQETQQLVQEVRNGDRAEDKWIAEFWSDDCPILTFTPAGRWISITNQIVERENLALDDAIYTYAKVGLALCDAGIKAWGEKYRYNTERPIDYIRRVMNDSEWNTIMCPDGSGGYYTPNFPTYPSGHATFAASAAEVLTDIFGQNYTFVDRSHEARTEFNGSPRSYNSFYSMAFENAYSRIPLGVHFRMDSDAASELGFKIGRRVNELPWKN